MQDRLFDVVIGNIKGTLSLENTTVKKDLQSEEYVLHEKSVYNSCNCSGKATRWASNEGY
ncbi:hypothetical protein HPB50_005096 [Hyalomma asiaticum]|uniref:Uncharacterized protein n=1 Tax=Hyalomma asiaticum TaxID=266040 RepID=A0ACB7SCE9_HYAAI|nr:hypothetical protein HPB50_005096 [Hyalomma asiaticum]